MKRIFCILVIVFCNFVFVNSVHAAEEYKIRIMAFDVTFRSGASTSSTKLGTLSANSVYTLLSTEKTNEFYKIEDEDGTVGYVSAYYAIPYIDLTSDLTSTTQSCLTNLRAEGFDDSYNQYLCFLQKKYPDWEFNAVKTGLEWEDAVEAESACGVSYISTSVSSYKDLTCSSYYDSGFYTASQTAVAYYMDPRNFLTDTRIFQFETLSYDSALSSSYSSLVKNIISGAAFYTYHFGIGNDLSTYITAAGKAENVSPTFLAARIYQEIGTSTSLYNLYSGVYTGESKVYYGYYNFVNYGVSDSCATTYGTTYCGLSAAKTYGWYGLTAALEGAAEKISQYYIAVGQDTSYFQKFNVNPDDKSKLYIHQYMTNIEAPYNEAMYSYDSYADENMLSNAFSFSIPIYNNMENEITNSDSGASGDSSSSGTSSLSVSSIVKSAGYTYTSSYISGFDVGDTVSEVKSAIAAIAGSSNVVIYDSDSKTVTSGVMKTGYKVKITNSSGSKTLSVVIYGDTSGDGEINALDLLQVQKNILGLYTLSGAYKEAGDTSGDGSVNALDLLQVQKSILGLYTIDQ